MHRVLVCDDGAKRCDGDEKTFSSPEEWMTKWTRTNQSKSKESERTEIEALLRRVKKVIGGVRVCPSSWGATDGLSLDCNPIKSAWSLLSLKHLPIIPHCKIKLTPTSFSCATVLTQTLWHLFCIDNNLENVPGVFMLCVNMRPIPSVSVLLRQRYALSMSFQFLALRALYHQSTHAYAFILVQWPFLTWNGLFAWPVGILVAVFLLKL